MRFEYRASPNLFIHGISVIGSFNEYQAEKGIMKKEEGVWVLDVPLPGGEYHYKFLMNNRFKINDPQANWYLPDQNQELWSVAVIDENGQRVYSDEQYEVTLEEYLLNSRIVKEEETTFIHKKQFNLNVDKMVAVRFEFSNITGIHEVTALWYTPNGMLHSYGKNNLYRNEQQPNKPVYLWFWVSFDEMDEDNSEGVWTLKLLIDGNYVFEDQLTISGSILY